MDNKSRQKGAGQTAEKTENYPDGDCTNSHLNTLRKMHKRIENKVDSQGRPETECIEAQEPEHSSENKFISQQIKHPCSSRKNHMARIPVL